MRTMKVIRDELGEASAAYHAVANTASAPEIRKHTERIRALQVELYQAIAAGANPCSRCGAQPIGLRHVHGSDSRGQVTWRHTFEIGCASCIDVKADVKDADGNVIKAKDDRRGFAETPREESGPEAEKHDETARASAVAKWNAKNPVK